MSTQPSPTNPVSQPGSGEAQLHRQILQALSGLRFGSVEVIVHEGKVTQIERKEKLRLPT